MSVQLKKYLKYTYKHHLRASWNKFRGVHLGKGVWLDKNVELMRHPENISIADSTIIKEGVRICACNDKAKIHIGVNTTIGYHTFMFASAGLEIGNDCMIAPFVYFVDSDHATKKGINLNQQKNSTAPIKVGNDVWIASNATILKGVSIADGAIVAANSLVNKNIGPNEIWAGTPAKKIGERE